MSGELDRQCVNIASARNLEMTLLAADMGGTKSSLWLFERENGRREIRDAVVRDGRAETPNLPWEVEQPALARRESRFAAH